MADYISNISKVIKTENNFSFVAEGKLYFLLLNMTSEYLYLQLKEDRSIISYTAILNLTDAKKEGLFYTCNTTQDLKETFDYIISEGKVILQLISNMTFKLILFNKYVQKYVSAVIVLNAEKIIHNNILYRIDEQLKFLLNILNEKQSIHNNNEDLKKELSLFTNHETCKIKTEEKRLKDRFKCLNDEMSKLSTGYYNFNEAIFNEENKDSEYEGIIHSLNEDLKLIQIGMEKLIKQATNKHTYKSELVTETNSFTLNCNKVVKNADEEIKLIKNNKEEHANLSKERLKSISESKIIGEHKRPINSIILLHNGHFASASDDGIIKLWNYKDHSLIDTLPHHNGAVTSLALLPDGNIAASADKTIKIWKYMDNEYKCINTLTGHEREIYCLLALTTGKLVSASFKTIKIWNSNYDCIKTIENYTTTLWSLANLFKEPSKALINLSGNYFAYGIEKTFKIWDENYIWVNTIEEDNDVNSLLLLPMGDIASGSFRTIKIWKCKNGYKDVYCIRTLTEHTDWVSAFCLLRDEFIVSASYDRTIKILYIKDDYKCIKILEGHRDIVKTLLLIDDGMISADKKIRLWNFREDVLN
jgi:WD40 repeat protein